MSADAFLTNASLSSTANALRFNPRSFARFIGDFLNTTLNCSSSIATTSLANVRASFPATISRGANATSVASLENFTFHGHTSWEMYRQNHFEIPLSTGSRSLSRTRI